MLVFRFNQTTQEVRMWHWERVLHYRRLEVKAAQRRDERKRIKWRDIANAHLGIVQTMNDLRECEATTAEQDLAKVKSC